MSQTLVESLLRALDITVFEHTMDGRFRTLGTAPEWLEAALGVTPSADPDAETRLPFLDHFLPQAWIAWHERRGARANSGPFAVQLGGEEALMRATALTVERRAILVIERLTGESDTRPMLQTAREQKLAAEQLAREASAVHAPAEAIARAVSALADARLDPTSRVLVDALVAASAQLQHAAAVLPKPPKPRRTRSS